MHCKQKPRKLTGGLPGHQEVSKEGPKAAPLVWLTDNKRSQLGAIFLDRKGKVLKIEERAEIAAKVGVAPRQVSNFLWAFSKSVKVGRQIVSLFRLSYVFFFFFSGPGERGGDGRRCKEGEGKGGE